MVFPVAAAIGLGSSKKNKAAEQQYQDQKAQAAKTNASSDYIMALARQLQAQGGGYTDPTGGGARYDPVTGTWKSTLGAQPAAVQDASYDEELARNTVDQTRRREGLIDVERMRRQASGEQDTALRDLNLFKTGIGKVDAGSLASTMRTNRTGVINAGYDDAARAASTIGLRTGQSAGDALSGIARNRSRDIATAIGDPETEALQLAEGINSNRLGEKVNLYNMFSGKAGNVYDAGFSPSTYAGDAADRGLASQGLDLQKFDTVLGGAGTAAAGYGAASNILRGGAQAKMANTDYNLGGKFLQGLGNSGIAEKLIGLFGKKAG
jgi:hypothetical protein